MQKLSNGIAALLLLVARALAAPPTTAPSAADSRIWRPRLITPAIVALDSPADREFTAEVRAPKSTTNWRAAIHNDLREWPCQLVSATYSTINRNTEPGWQIRVRVPVGAPPELFSLTLNSSQGPSTQDQSVSVCKSFNDDFYILHLADEQIVNDKHTDPSGQYYRTVGTAEEMRGLQQPINLTHPRLVFITGDQIDFNGALDGWNNWHNWGYEPGAKKHFSRDETLQIEERLSAMYLDTHHGYRVPYVEAPGNHDVTPADKKLYGSDIVWHPISVRIYETYFGQRSWSFRMGDFYVLLHDWSEHSLRDWADADFTASLKDPKIHYRLVGQHFNTDQAFIPETCDLMLIGHGHAVKTMQTEPYYIYMDGPAFRYGSTGFFNFRHKPEGGWTCDQTVAPRDVAKDVWPLFTDNGVVKKVRCDRADSMNVTERSVTITNDLPREFYDGRVRFVLNKGHYTSVKNGQILAQYDCDNNAKTAVLVKVDIPAAGSVTVTVENPSK